MEAQVQLRACWQWSRQEVAVVWTRMVAVGVERSGKVCDIFGRKNCRAWRYIGYGDEGERAVKDSS